MPDHVHLFSTPASRSSVPLSGWVHYWKSELTKSCEMARGIWQPGCWDSRLRTNESYESKWEYVRNNPVRAGLCENADDWLFQGELYVLGRDSTS